MVFCLHIVYHSQILIARIGIQYSYENNFGCYWRNAGWMVSDVFLQLIWSWVTGADAAVSLSKAM